MIMRAGGHGGTGINLPVLLVVGALTVATLTVGPDDTTARLADPWTWVLTAGMVAPLAWLRRHPLLAALLSSASALITASLGHPVNAGYFCAVACLAVATYRWGRLAAVLAGLVAVSSVALLSVYIASLDGEPYTPADFLLQVSILVTPLVVADLWRVRSAREADRRREAALLLELAAREAREAAATERLRLAHEVHDIVGHHLSAIAVQARAGRLPGAPSQEILAEIAGLASRALEETRSALASERQHVESRPEPGVGLALLPDLTGALQGAGLTVDLHVVGVARPLPPAVDEAAYRVVQESLTNVLRHSTARTARVEVRHGSADVLLAVHDSGEPRHKHIDPGPVHSSGVEGMAHRVRALGGTLTAGPRDPGPGWSVEARLPVPRSSSPHHSPTSSAEVLDARLAR